jgi:hypothetical protein
MNSSDPLAGTIMPCLRWLCLAILLIPLTADPGWPQGTRRTPKPPPKAPPFELSGTFQRVEGDVVVMRTAAGYTWYLRPAPKVQIHFVGKATPAFLTSGQAVAFFAKLDKRRGETVEEVQRLTVFTPNEKRQFGIQPDLGFGDLERKSFEERQRNEALKRSPGVLSSPGVASTATTGVPPAQKEERTKKRPPSRSGDVDSFIVRGRILSATKGELLVEVPDNGFVRNRLTVEIADTADVSVELDGLPVLLLGQPGDHVQASGDQVAEGRGFAKDLRFRAARVLGAQTDGKKPRGKKD